MLFELILQNRLLVETAYAAIIILASIFMFTRSGRMHKLSGHQGLGYFSLAFLFYALGFLAGYMSIFPGFGVAIAGFEYFLAMAGFYLVYSLIWKEFDRSRIILLHVVAASIAMADYFFGTELIYYSQLAAFSYASWLAWREYRHKKEMQLYLITLVLILIGWTINLMIRYLYLVLPDLVALSYLVNTSIFIMFVYLALGHGERRRALAAGAVLLSVIAYVAARSLSTVSWIAQLYDYLLIALGIVIAGWLLLREGWERKERD